MEPGLSSYATFRPCYTRLFDLLLFYCTTKSLFSQIIFFINSNNIWLVFYSILPRKIQLISVIKIKSFPLLSFIKNFVIAKKLSLKLLRIVFYFLHLMEVVLLYFYLLYIFQFLHKVSIIHIKNFFVFIITIVL